MPNVWTIGYEGRTPEEVLGALRDYDIERVVDVRGLPLTQAAAFNPGALGRFLAGHKIEYDLRRELGAPRDIQAQSTGDVEAFRAAYDQAVPNKAVEELARLCGRQRCCVLSEERDPERSVRMPLGLRLERQGLQVRHIL